MLRSVDSLFEVWAALTAGARVTHVPESPDGSSVRARTAWSFEYGTEVGCELRPAPSVSLGPYVFFALTIPGDDPIVPAIGGIGLRLGFGLVSETSHSAFARNRRVSPTGSQA